ncbi:hypothetical protein WJX82_003328 [Trebouxia sp. C0006]
MPPKAQKKPAEPAARSLDAKIWPFRTAWAECHCYSESRIMWLQGRMPLHRAISAGQLHIVRYCLTKQSLPEIDGQDLGQPSLTSACHVEDLQMCKDMMEELFAAGACINRTSQDGETCLHAAASCNNVVASKWLLLHGADLAAHNRDGWTPLHCARFLGLCLHSVQMPIWCSLTMTTTMVGLRALCFKKAPRRVM